MRIARMIPRTACPLRASGRSDLASGVIDPVDGHLTVH